ncbi:MAG TPA: NAD-dependent epimerase/dehydratase family protein, partial [Chthoniobacteraceae bacterium]|nr:NAD-dependent epimerase/dehydratase family protein [Chthoniobacteraceae bacterium]
MKNVLVTGAAGFLGRYIVREFADAETTVMGVDVIDPEAVALGDGVLYEQIALPSDEFDRVVAEFVPQICIHCAGRASVALSMQDPLTDFGDSVGLTFQTLDTLRRLAPACRFVFLSSAAVYG